jgi:hypothetical protein
LFYGKLEDEYVVYVLKLYKFNNMDLQTPEELTDFDYETKVRE